MKPWDIIHAIKETAGKNAKAEIIDRVEDDSEFWPGTFYALDQLTTFGIKRLPKPASHGGGTKWSEFDVIAKKLMARELTGNAARDAILEFAERCTEAQWTWWYSRILERKLDCGVDTTITKRAPDKYKARDWPWQGAVDIKNVKEKHIPEDAFLEAKYDGMRSFWLLKPGTPVQCFSRNGKELFNFTEITEELTHLVAKDGFPKEGLVMDGEVVSLTFNALMKEARRKTDSKFDGYLMAFDLIPMDTFFARGKTATLEKRREVLEEVVAFHHEDFPDSRVQLSLYVRVNARRDQHIVMNFFQQQVEAGFEGIIIKGVDGLYNFVKDRTWLKMKPTDTWDLPIVGFQEGTGRLTGSLGALLCEGMDDKGHNVRVDVGSGMSDEQRHSFWKSQEEIMGTVVEILADSLSQNQDGSYSLRFPRFVRFRDDCIPK